MAIEKEYRGFKIGFVEEKEIWSVRITETDGSGEYKDVTDISLEVVKKYIDKHLKKSFQRVRVFAQKPYLYGYNKGKDTRPYIMAAEITSISPDGEMFMVFDGEKSARKYHGAAYIDSKENTDLIDAIVMLDREIQEKQEQKTSKELLLQKVDTKKMTDEFLKP